MFIPFLFEQSYAFLGLISLHAMFIICLIFIYTGLHTSNIFLMGTMLLFNFSMRRSSRQKRPTRKAAETTPDGREPPRRRPRLEPEPVLEQQETPQIDNSLPDGMIERIVATVTEQVTQRLAPLLQSVPADQTAPIIQPEAQVDQESAIQPTSLPGMHIQQPVPSALVSLVHNGIQDAHAAIAGENSSTTGSTPGLLFKSSSLPLDARVSDKLKLKIWNNEYIELSSLLSSSVSEERFKISVSTSNQDAPSLFLEPSVKAKKINSFEIWLQAFHIFVGIYTSKYPSEAPALMNYGDIVRDLAARGHNWVFYDENFRFLKQSHKQLLQWGEIHWELWLRSQPVQQKRSFSNTRGHTSNANSIPRHVPRGFCFKYHKGGDCDGCDHKHSCFKCGGNHRGFQCNFRPQGNFRPSQRNNNLSSPASIPSTNPNKI